MPTEPNPETTDTRPYLWNPRAAIYWSLLFSPVWGSSLHAANWRALGKPEKASSEVAWIVGYLIIQIACLVAGLYGSLPEAVNIALPPLFLALLAVWVSHANRQVLYVKDVLKGEYIKRGWGLPLVAGLGLQLVVVFAATVSAGALHQPEGSEIAAKLRPLLYDEWAKNPAAKGAVIKRINLVHMDGKRYEGSVEATIGGQLQTLALDVVYDRGTISFATR